MQHMRYYTRSRARTDGDFHGAGVDSQRQRALRDNLTSIRGLLVRLGGALPRKVGDTAVPKAPPVRHCTGGPLPRCGCARCIDSDAPHGLTARSLAMTVAQRGPASDDAAQHDPRLSLVIDMLLHRRAIS